MANTKQAKKRVRQSEKHRQHNASLRSMLRTYVKRVASAITTGDGKAALKELMNATPIIDRMVNKKITHKNKAARYKSRLTARIKSLMGNA